MSSPRIIAVTRRLPAASLALLSAHPNTQLRLHDSDDALPAADLPAFVAGASAVLCVLPDRFDAAVLAAAAPTLRVLATMAVGYSNVDVPAALAGRVRIGNTPGVLTDTTADLVLALTLATCRLIPQAVQAVRSGEWKSWKPFWSAWAARAWAGLRARSLPPLT
jgi:lactate dehydrogenase-like 2-hydroxyacid dehydrogenase